jgi:hypothetical protein
MAMTETLPHAGGFLAHEQSDFLSREAVTIAHSKPLRAGAVLGRITLGAVTITPAPGNAGDGVMGTVTPGPRAKAGAYALTCIVAAANGGTFAVTDPDGYRLADLTVGAAYAGPHLAMTLADGAADFVAGDRFTVSIAAGSGKCVELAPAAVDGSQRAAGILYADRDATDADIEGAAVVRMAAVIGAMLVWPEGITDQERATGIVDLALNSIIVR